MLTVTFVVPLLAVVATADAQQHTSEPTLLELARQREGMFRINSGCGPAVPLEDIVSKAHLIIYGTVVAVEARLSSDGRHILTDHHVQPINIVYDDLTPATGASQQTPVFTAWGGNLVIEGLQISDIVAQQPQGSVVRGR